MSTLPPLKSTSRQNPGLAGTVVLVTFAILLSLISGPIAGAVLAKGWEWFVVDTFGLPGISVAQAWGLRLLSGFVVHTPTDDDDRITPAETTVTNFLMSLTRSAMAFAAFSLVVQFL